MEKQLKSEKIRKIVWTGKLPVRFILDSYDNASLEMPNPIYLMIPRNAQIGLFINRIKQDFDTYAPNTALTQPIWFEMAGKPLAWDIPFGAVFDV